MSVDSLVEARGLTRRYGGNTAVADLDLRLRQGEILGLLGPNGAGKTTTLRMLAGCLAPSAGRIRIRGLDMARRPVRAKAHLGYLPERPPLYPELTVAEQLAFSARLHRVPGTQRDQAVASAMEDCGIADVGRRAIGNLSKGYQQRVGIAQAILHRPDVVILDEPTAGLDPNQIREIRALIRRLGEQHSVILSSHILPEIQATCSRVAIIHRGRLVYDRDMTEAQTQTQTGVVTVGFRQSPEADVLVGIEGVRTASRVDGQHWRLHVEAGAEIRDVLADRAATGGWGLFELHAEQHGLEDIFTALTAGADHVDAAA